MKAQTVKWENESLKVTLKESSDPRIDGSTGDAYHGVQCVGRVTFLFDHPFLRALAKAKKEKYGKLSNGVALTGFKLESVVFSTEGMVDNAKLIPLLNGDTMTLTNACKAGRMTIPATRTSAGIENGDLVAIGNFIRGQGDDVGGNLTVKWNLNGKPRQIKFKKVCFQKVDPLKLAGNDLPDMNVIITYATFEDDDLKWWS